MKKLLVAATSLLLLTGSAFAADLPPRKTPLPPPPPPPSIWTGFYAGLNAGYGWGTDGNTYSGLVNAGSWSQTTTVLPNNVYPSPPGLPPGTSVVGNSLIGIAYSPVVSGFTQSGFIGGGQLGYNLQFNEKYLLGVEADIQGANFGEIEQVQVSLEPDLQMAPLQVAISEIKTAFYLIKLRRT